MILKDLETYIKTRRQISLKDIARHFDVAPLALEGMLNFWISKGRIKVSTNSGACPSGCYCSHKDDSAVYAWDPQTNGVKSVLIVYI